MKYRVEFKVYKSYFVDASSKDDAIEKAIDLVDGDYDSDILVEERRGL